MTPGNNETTDMVSHECQPDIVFGKSEDEINRDERPEAKSENVYQVDAIFFHMIIIRKFLLIIRYSG